MTTSGNDSGNKAALRASLKKEDESLGERLAASDVPLLVPAATEDVPAPIPPAEVPVTPLGQANAARTSAQRSAPGKRGAKAVATGKAAASRAPGNKAIDPAATVKGEKKAALPAKAGKAVQPAKTVAGDKKPAKSRRAGEQVVSTAKDKRDKVVRLSVEIFKSEEAAIEAARADLVKLVGWAVSRSDILRAGVRLFAEQKLEQMKDVLDGLPRMAAGKGKKKS
ncbi:MAG: hypothetical protein RKP46_05200 [Candidatus Accumulibacter sp.]|uniref:hypothetical protein n=1 Tax=Accumulibacter sp. TaxID=2053492 RepID=UPI00287A1833|nr:hypothetical protein [Accumulibacter sp.]MDS4013739.1 hypothetical protein [Accumulibacter sp.]